MEDGSSPKHLVGTAKGLYELGAETRTHLAGRSITALARDGPVWWAIVDGGSIWRARETEPWEEVTRLDGREATCLGPTTAGLLVGTKGAHLLRLDGRRLIPVKSFEEVDGRQKWYTPWGDPPDTRSLASDVSGGIYVNVHVGGVVRSTDHGGSWRPTLDIEADVHQVLAHPTRPGLVVVAAAAGFGISADRGESWTYETAGLHATYSRAVAFADDVVLLTASTGPSGRQAAVYRRAIGGEASFARCRRGLPEWFPRNVDTTCLAASGRTVALGAPDGSVFVSTDQGDSWNRIATELPEIHCVAIGCLRVNGT